MSWFPFSAGLATILTEKLYILPQALQEYTKIASYQILI